MSFWKVNVVLSELLTRLGFISVVLFIMVGPSLFSYLRFQRLMREGILTEATVTHCGEYRTNTGKHISYAYSVNDKGVRTKYEERHRVVGVYCFGTEEPIEIRYDPDRVHVSNIVGNRRPLQGVREWGVRAGAFLIFVSPSSFSRPSFKERIEMARGKRGNIR